MSSLESPTAAVGTGAKAPEEETFSGQASFSAHLQSSTRILALLGAGLSASSGLATFRGAGGMWRSHDAMSLATPEAFRRDPALVWQFYGYRRHMAFRARPNAAHHALAELARRREGFVTLTQNVDGLSPRANHPASQLHLLHGSLSDLTCFNKGCDYIEKNNLADPLVPELEVKDDVDPTARPAAETTSAADPDTSFPSIQSRVSRLDPATSGTSQAYVAPDSETTVPVSALPRCPKCGTGLLRPGVVWFGEALPEETIAAVDKWIEESEKIDLMLVIGTTAKVYPAAQYISIAREKGARIAVVNIENDHLGAARQLTDKDWMFQGDAAAILPVIFKDIIGELKIED